jgi:hypothetical protein
LTLLCIGFWGNYDAIRTHVNASTASTTAASSLGSDRPETAPWRNIRGSTTQLGSASAEAISALVKRKIEQRVVRRVLVWAVTAADRNSAEAALLSQMLGQMFGVRAKTGR